MSGKENKSRIIFICALLIIGGGLYYASTFSSQTKFSSPFVLKKQNQKVSVLVVGDIMLDRYVGNRINLLGFDAYFAGVKSLVSGADIAVGNLEGPFTTFKSITLDGKSRELKFTFDPKLVSKLSDLGFDIVGLANNHTYNFGREGLDMTHKYLRDSGIFYYGDPFNRDEIGVITAKNGISVGFVGFHEFYYTNFDKVFREIENLRPLVDVLVVSPHWGIEYQKEPTEKMKKWAREFIDSGADVVIGAHPHIIGNIEEYKGKIIFYSLGNFVFDQYFSEETMTGLSVELHIEKSEKGLVSIEYQEIPIKMDKNGVRVFQ